MSYRTAILLQALAAILLSTAGLLIKVITLNPMALLGLRSLIAAVVIGLYMGKPRFTWSLPQVGGALAVVGAQAFFILSTRETTAANAIFIQYTAPIYVALFGVWFLHEPVRRVDWWTMAAVGAGLFLFLNDGLTAGNMRGNVYALLAGISFAWFLLFMRKQKDASPIETVFLGNVLAALVGLPFLVGQSPTLGDWAGVTFLGAFQIGLPFILMSYTIKRLTAVETVLIQTLEPICNPIWVVLVLGERPSALALLGGLIVIVAVTARSIVVGVQERQAAQGRARVPA